MSEVIEVVKTIQIRYVIVETAIDFEVELEEGEEIVCIETVNKHRRIVYIGRVREGDEIAD